MRWVQRRAVCRRASARVRSCVRRGIAAAVWMTAAGCTSTSWHERGDDVGVRAGFGGLVLPIFARYDRFADEGKRVVIDGHVISADAFAAFGSPGACYTYRAAFSPHAISNLGVVPDYRLTRLIAARLPEPLERWFMSDHSSSDWISFKRLEFPQLTRLWPEGRCREDLEEGMRRYELMTSRRPVLGSRR